MLTEEQVAEIEARANAASPHYVVDWEKGDHAWMQASGWRSANEEQPRTIAAFDKDDGYLDLLFCAEARTDIPALCQTVRALRAALEESEAHNRVLRERLVIADGVYDVRGEYTFHAQTAIHRAVSELQSQLAAVTQERDIAVRYLAKHDFERCAEPDHGCEGRHPKL